MSETERCRKCGEPSDALLCLGDGIYEHCLDSTCIDALRAQLAAAEARVAKLEREVQQAEQQVPPSVWGIKAATWEEAARVVRGLAVSQEPKGCKCGDCVHISEVVAALRERGKA